MPTPGLPCGIRVEPFQRIGAHRFQQSEAHTTPDGFRHHERLCDQSGNRVGNIALGHGTGSDRDGSVQCEVGGEHPQPAEQGPLLGTQQIKTPVQRRAQRPMARQRGPPPPRQEPEPIVQRGRHTRDPQHHGARGCEFNGQRHAVQTPAYRRDHVRQRVIHWRQSAGLPGPGQKQPHCAVTDQIIGRCRLRGRHHQRRYLVDPLPLRPQRLATGGQDLRPRRTTEQRLGDSRHGVDQVFAVIQDQQHPPRPQSRRDELRPQRHLQAPQVERRGHRRQHQVRFRYCGQIHQMDARRVFSGQAPGRTQRQACLADPTRTGQRQQAVLCLQLDHLPQILLATDQLADRKRRAQCRWPFVLRIRCHRRR